MTQRVIDVHGHVPVAIYVLRSRLPRLGSLHQVRLSSRSRHSSLEGCRITREKSCSECTPELDDLICFLAVPLPRRPRDVHQRLERQKPQQRDEVRC